MTAAAFPVGPFVVPLQSLLLAAAFVAAVGTARLAGGSAGGGIAKALADMVIGGLLVARAAFVAAWWDLYAAQPLSMLDIRDGGFTAWAGIAGAFAVAAWQARRHRALRRPLAVGLAGGAITWGILFALAHEAHGTPQRLPELELATAAGERTSIAALGKGHPTVVNLWASWCPPCRREMPVLAEAQAREPGVRFVFPNQGEDAATIQRFLASHAPGLSNVLVDGEGRLGRELRSAGLPATFFFDAIGRLADVHLGELSRASLAAKLATVRTATPPPIPYGEPRP